MSTLSLNKDGWQPVAVGGLEAEFFAVPQHWGVSFLIRQTAWDLGQDLTTDQRLAGLCNMLHSLVPRGQGADIEFFCMTSHPQAPEHVRREKLIFEEVRDHAGQVVSLKPLRTISLQSAGGLPADVAQVAGVERLATEAEITDFIDSHAARSRGNQETIALFQPWAWPEKHRNIGHPADDDVENFIDKYTLRPDEGTKA